MILLWMTDFAMEDMSVNGYLAKECLFSDSFNVLKIDADLFSWETPLEAAFKEFMRLCNIDKEVFSYDVFVRYTGEELSLLWPTIEAEGLNWTTIEEDDGKFSLAYMDSSNNNGGGV